MPARPQRTDSNQRGLRSCTPVQLRTEPQLKQFEVELGYFVIIFYVFKENSTIFLSYIGQWVQQYWLLEILPYVYLDSILLQRNPSDVHALVKGTYQAVKSFRELNSADVKMDDGLSLPCMEQSPLFVIYYGSYYNIY